ncbi:hypothetical protein LEP1GSC044_1999 [Leptospira kirschneri serovar Grippotyphosa str. RM52]|nr:hypothetical protein LEP1GSC044_1999 [Leptospira kirschneri serovar Grippotyphosa str. RM52]EMN04031.1 hypothetical protein LEP1GSC046_0358 [Leptospira kirschneri serovar Bim str. 1051]
MNFIFFLFVIRNRILPFLDRFFSKTDFYKLKSIFLKYLSGINSWKNPRSIFS